MVETDMSLDPSLVPDQHTNSKRVANLGLRHHLVLK